MSDEKLITKIKKLLRLVDKNTNEAESQSAWAKVQELVTKHQLNLEQLRQTGAEEEPDMVEELYRGAAEKWERKLLHNIALANDCEIIMEGKKRWLLGAQEDVHIVQILTKSVIGQIKQMARTEFAASWQRERDRSIWERSYAWGASMRVSDRVREQKVKQTSESTALVHVRAARTESFVNNKYPDLRPISSRPSSVYNSVVDLGRSHGDRVQINTLIA